MMSHDLGDPPGHAFISYVHEDAERVDRLQRILEAAGIRIWRDTNDLWPGQDWKIEVKRAISSGSLAFIACFSENSQRRAATYQNEELALATEQMRLRQPGISWLIPIRFAQCDIPIFDLGAGRTLESLQHVDLFGDSWERGAARLVAAVLRILDSAASAERGSASTTSGEATRAEGAKERKAGPERPLNSFSTVFRRQRMRGDFSSA